LLETNRSRTHNAAITNPAIARDRAYYVLSESQLARQVAGVGRFAVLLFACSAFAPPLSRHFSLGFHTAISLNTRAYASTGEWRRQCGAPLGRDGQ
jgi:hypothetical protein